MARQAANNNAKARVRYKMGTALAAALAATTACNSNPFSGVAQQAKDAYAKLGPRDLTHIEGQAKLPPGVTQLPTLANATPLANVTPLSNVTPLTGADGGKLSNVTPLTAVTPYRILTRYFAQDDEITKIIDGQLAFVTVRVINPRDGKAIAQGHSTVDGKFALTIRLDPAPKGLIVEVVLLGAAGPVGYLASPFKAPELPDPGIVRHVDLTISSTAMVYAGYQLADLAKNFNLSDLSTRKNPFLARLFTRIDDQAIIQAADKLGSASAFQSGGSLQIASDAAVSLSSLLASRAYQGYLRTERVKYGPSTEAVMGTFLSEFASRINQLPAAPPPDITAADKVSADVVRGASPSLYEKAANADKTAKGVGAMVLVPGVEDDDSSTPPPYLIKVTPPPPSPAPTPEATDVDTIPKASASASPAPTPSAKP